MKKFSVFSVLLIFALLLAACGEAGVTDADLTATAEIGVAPGLETPDVLDETPGVVDVTPDILATPMVETPLVETPMETPVETPVVGTPGAGQPGTGTGTPAAGEPGIPVTGMVDFVRVSELIGFDVEATGGAGAGNGTGTGAVQTPDPSVNQTGTPGTTDQTQTPDTGAGTGTPTGQAGTDLDEGERVGSVSDVVVRMDNQENQQRNQMGDLTISQDQVNVWLIVTIDEGFLGLGADTLVAVPLRNARVDMDREVILLDFDPARIENAPTFTEDDWDDIVNPDWDAQFRGYWLDGEMGIPTTGSQQQTETPAAGTTQLATGTPGAGMTQQQTGTPAAGTGTQQTATPGGTTQQQTATPAGTIQQQTATPGGTTQQATPTPGQGDTPGTTVSGVVSFVRLSVVLDSEVRASGVASTRGVDVGGTTQQQTGTPAAGMTQQQTGTPAAGTGTQQTATPGGTTQQQTATPAGTILQETPAAGTGQDTDNNRLGEVADVVLNLGGDRTDLTTGQDTGTGNLVGRHAEVLYLVVDLDDDVVQQDDDQGNLVMVPWQSVRSVDDENNVVVVDVDVMQLGQAHRFGDDEWPTFTTDDWDEQVRDFWGDVTGNRTNP